MRDIDSYRPACAWVPAYLQITSVQHHVLIHNSSACLTLGDITLHYKAGMQHLHLVDVWSRVTARSAELTSTPPLGAGQITIALGALIHGCACAARLKLKVCIQAILSDLSTCVCEQHPKSCEPTDACRPRYALQVGVCNTAFHCRCTSYQIPRAAVTTWQSMSKERQDNRCSKVPEHPLIYNNLYAPPDKASL